MLTVSKNGKYIEKNGVFFPYLADTAWTLAQRLDRDEILFYLDKRKSQGFNAVQVSAISELDGLRVPNREGYVPFVNGNVKKPCAEYFSLIAFIADACEERSMVLVLLPTWGDKFNCKWGIGPEIFTPENSVLYGRYIAGVIGARENVIWMLGGDRPIESSIHRDIIDEMARGIRESEQVRHLMTYHPNGEASSVMFLRDADYIDYHSLQSGHSFGGIRSEKMVRRTISMGRKPCIDAECFYEDFPIDFSTEWNYRFTDLSIMRRIYKNMIAGAAGHTYGHQSVWCFHDKADGEYLYDWKTALDRPMANKVKYINKLLKTVDITSSKFSSRALGALMCEGDGYALVYLCGGEPCFIDWKGSCPYGCLVWFNPVNGEFAASKKISAKKMTLISPFEHDAIAILK